MKRTLLLALLLLVCPLLRGRAQIGVVSDRADALDTLRTHSWSAGLSFLFYISDDEMNDHTTYRFLNSAHFTYVFNRTDVEMGLRQAIERQDGGKWVSNNLLMLSAGIYKYKPLGNGNAVLRKLYVEPIAVYQDNSDRGLRRRFQLGGLFHPWGYYRPKFNANIGVGVVYDWSSWEVNDRRAIEAAPPALREKIEFINSRVRLRKDMYQDFSEWRPMLLATVNYKMSSAVNFLLYAAYQQSLVSPYSREIKDAYPDLAKVYPYILTQFDINFKLYKGLAMSLSASVDYENSNLSLYKSSWDYSMLVGFSWTFSNQRIRPDKR